jgi:D-alanyl-D-alanine carboxypeptidase (penicillin-binding protein 5/6)
VRLAHKAAENNLYVSISSLASFDFAPQNANVRTVYNRNALVSQFSAPGYTNKYAKGLISGSTDNGGYVLASYAEKDGTRYLCVVMGALRDGDMIYSYKAANTLFDTVFYKYQLVKIAKAKEAFFKQNIKLTVEGANSADSVCVVRDDVYAFISADIDIEKDITHKAYLHNKSIFAPIKSGDVVGGVDFYCNGALVASEPLVANEDVEANSILLSMFLVKNFLFSRAFISGFVVSVVLCSIYLHHEAKTRRHKRVGTVTFKNFS